jgi:hypothetical protein
MGFTLSPFFGILLFLFHLFRKGGAKSVSFAIVRTLTPVPCFANMGACAAAQKVQS